MAARDIALSGEQQDRLAQAIKTWRGAARLEPFAEMVKVSSKTLSRYERKESPNVQRGALEAISLGVGVSSTALHDHVILGGFLPDAAFTPQTLGEQVAEIKRELGELRTLVLDLARPK